MGFHMSKNVETKNPIAPQSVIRLADTGRKSRWWRDNIGRTFRVGYYSRQDGLDCIWIVNDDGQYEQTIDHEFLYKYFDVIHQPNDTNWYGRRRSKLTPIRRAEAKRRSSRNGASR
jgi:hypothetical protein